MGSPNSGGHYPGRIHGGCKAWTGEGARCVSQWSERLGRRVTLLIWPGPGSALRLKH